MSSGWNDPRPMSPFTSIWRWHVTMVTSILHRASGMVLAAGSVLIVAWLFALAAGEKQYDKMMELLGSWPGKAVLFAFSLALFFHLLNGVRYLLWDSGYGFEKETANRTSWLVMVMALALTLGLWAAGYWMFEAFPGQKSH
ncbi:MAG: succinate dehydrogenase, cytochrome b556 subunit [Robiginitomaculum sp.]|nr:succinate dehydrogenase, cytochrome b556 subunit [Robiginitomaculum sp.]